MFDPSSADSIASSILVLASKLYTVTAPNRSNAVRNLNISDLNQQPNLQLSAFSERFSCRRIPLC